MVTDTGCPASADQQADTPSRSRILIVDDTASGRYALGRTLSKAGFAVAEAASGWDGLNQAIGSKPDLIILDVQLPDISGFEVCRLLKENPATARTPVLQVSAHFKEPEDLARGLEGGADSYLVHPIEPLVLIATVKALLRISRAEQELHRLNQRLAKEIDERKQAEEQRQRSQSLLSEAAELSHVGAWEWDLTTDQWTFSEEWRVIHGCTKRTLSPDELLSIAHPDDQAAIARAFDNARRGVASYDLEHRIVRLNDGQVRWVRARGEFVRDSAGKVARLYGFAQDITEQKWAEEAVTRQSELLAGIVENIPVLLCIWDPQLKRFQFNQHMREVLGWTEADAAEGDFMAKVYPDAAYRQQVTEYMQSLERGWRDLKTTAKDGTAIDISWANVALPDGRTIGIGIDIRPRKAAEEELRDTEHEKSLILDNANEIIAFHDTENNLIWANKAYLKSTRLPLSQLKGRKCYQCWGLDGKCEHCPVVTAIQTGDPQEAELTPENQPHWPATQGSWQVRAAAVRDSAGRIIGAIEIAHDITERKQTEKALRESEERLKLATEATGYGTFDYDLASGRLIWSPHARRHFGLGLDAPVDYGVFLKGLHPQDRDRVHRTVQEALQPGSGGFYQTEYRTIGIEDGQERWLAATGRVFFDEPGRAVRFIGATVDITERKKAEEALRQARDEAQRRAQEAEERGRLLAAMMEHIPLGITIADAPDVHIRAVSRYGQELTGQPRQQIEGIPVDLHVQRWHILRRDGVTPATNEELPLTRATQKGEIVREEEFVIVRPDGTKVPILCTAAPIRDGQGNITGGVIGWQDITEQKRARQELRQWKDELEIRVEQRTAELAAANKELEAFGYTVSHDLRAPLRHIVGFVNLLRAHATASLDEEGREYLKTIAESAGRMGHLIDDLLTLSRLGRATMTESDVDLRRLVDEAITELAPAIDGRSIDWRIGPLPCVRGDRTLLRNAMVNLVSNAVKYSRNRNPARIEIGSEQHDGEAVCYVRDNGAGFDMRFADKLFGVFQRLHVAEEFEGTGIGLASVRRIIQRHGGRVWAEGAVDQGATFYFALPRSKSNGWTG